MPPISEEKMIKLLNNQKEEMVKLLNSQKEEILQGVNPRFEELSQGLNEVKNIALDAATKAKEAHDDLEMVKNQIQNLEKKILSSKIL